MNKYYKYHEFKDGSEEYLLKIFTKTKNISSYPVELYKYIKDWPTLYHLSYKRVNLLEGIKELFDNSWNVLELGGGTGAISYWLADFFKKLIVVEGSYNRAKILKERLRNKKNVTIIVDDIRTVNFSEKFNLILLVGVLEYIPYFSDTEDSLEACRVFLNKIMRHLEDEGVLLIAIENRLGVKYLAGCPEDHTGEIFYGLIGYPEHSPITFSRNEIADLLDKSGFEQIIFYHLFPDYKFPVLFLRDDFYNYGIEPASWIRGNFDDPFKKRLFFYPDTLLIDTFSKAGLLQHFSNSFLILCTKKSGQNNRLKTSWIIKKFWNHLNTIPILHHTISLMKDGEKLVIERTPLNSNVYDIDLGNFRFHLIKKDEFKYGTPLIIEVYRNILKKDYTKAIIENLKIIQKELLKKYNTLKKDHHGYYLIKGEALDFTIWNLLKNNNELIFFDKKWHSKNPISVDFIFFRSLFYLYRDIYPFIDIDCESFIINILKSILPSYNHDSFIKNLALENEFQNSISLIKNYNPYDIQFSKMADINKKINILNFSNYKLKELQNELNSIYNSRGWKVLSTYYKIRDNLLKKLKNVASKISRRF